MISGPMFAPSEDKERESLFGKSGGHYNIFRWRDEDAPLRTLREIFPTGNANELNFVVFSTSGVHGSYQTLDEAIKEVPRRRGRKAREWGTLICSLCDGDGCADCHNGGEAAGFPSVTLLLIQPRLVSMTYGNVTIRNQDDADFLLELRRTSQKVTSQIGGGSQ